MVLALGITIIILLGLCGYLHFRYRQITKERDFAINSVQALYNKPITAMITETQVQHMSKLIAEYIKEPKWLN